MNAKQLLVTAAMAGILSAGPMVVSTAAQADDAKGNCTEKNACMGKGHCAGIAQGKEHACAGQNTCASNQIYNITKVQCDQYGGDWAPPTDSAE